MQFNRVSTNLFILLILVTTLAACSPAAAPTHSPPIISVVTPAPTAPAATATSIPITSTAAALPDWFNIKMTDVRTGQTFSINRFLRESGVG